MFDNIFTRFLTSFSFLAPFVSLLLLFTFPMCLHLRLWCLCKLLCSEVFFTYEIGSSSVKFLLTRCVLIWGLQKSIGTMFVYRPLENCKAAILTSLSLSYSHPSMPGPASLQSSVQLLSLCWPFCLQTWTIVGEKIPSSSSIQCPTVPEIPTRGWKVSPVRYSACFHNSHCLLFSEAFSPYTAQENLK